MSGQTEVVLVECKAREAMAVYCDTCKWATTNVTFWPLRQSKGLHERGTGHKVYYVRLEQ